jgi:MFS superfamily sulfate permease-like transporter
VILDFAGVNFVDSQGSAELRKISTAATNAGASLRLARVKPEVLSVLRADGVVDLIGEDHFHANLQEAVTVELSSGHPD